MNSAIDAEKAFEKSQYPFMILKKKNQLSTIRE